MLIPSTEETRAGSPGVLGAVRAAMFSPLKSKPERFVFTAIVLLLTLLFSAQLLLSIRQESQTSDEGVHIFAGYRYWKYLDFSGNPEHPPLVKLVAALPLLSLPLRQPPARAAASKLSDFDNGIKFLYRNDAGAILFRARAAASVFAFLLAGLVLCCGYELGGTGVALLAFILFIFEPNILAHGALVTTDMAASCFLFASIYAFYRYVQEPGRTRLAVCAVAVGLLLASKHSGILIVPILVLLAVIDAMLYGGQPESVTAGGASANRIARRLLLCASILAIGFCGLWIFYAFRFGPGPNSAPFATTLHDYAHTLHSRIETLFVLGLARTHLLPEAYLYGLTDVLQGAEGRPVFFLGNVYATGRWIYFPFVLLAKNTLPILALLICVPFAKRLRDSKQGREFLFLALPPAIYLLAAMSSRMNLGVRHILPIFPFVIVICALTAGRIASRSVVGLAAVALLLLLHAGSSLSAFPNYLSYSNALAGGPSKTYRVLSDSNSDWGEGLKQVERYVVQNQISDCWFAYSLPGIDFGYYNIPCKPLPPAIAHIATYPTPIVPPSIEGTVFISASEAAGHAWGPGELNPYGSFLFRPPADLIGDSILVFKGRFDVPLAAAVTHEDEAAEQGRQGKWENAIEQARAAVALVPGSADAQASLCLALLGAGKTGEAKPACEAAEAIASAVHPDFQFRWVSNVRAAASRRPE